MMTNTASHPEPVADPLPRERNSGSGPVTASAHRRRVINWKVLVITAVILVIGVPAAWFAHKLQVGRTARVFLRDADTREKAGELDRAAESLANYLQLKPSDDEQRIRHAEMVASLSAEQPERAHQASALLYRAIGVAGSDEQKVRLRRTLGELLLKIGRTKSAQDLMAAQPRSSDDQNRHPPESETDRRILALAAFGRLMQGAVQGDVTLAEPDGGSRKYAISELLEIAFTSNPQDIELARALAYVYRNHPAAMPSQAAPRTDAQRNALADAVMDRLVGADPKNPKTLLARYQYRAVYHPDEAEEDLQAALEQGPQEMDVLLAAAEHARTKADGIQERANYTALLEESERELSFQTADTAEPTGTAPANAGRELYVEAQSLYLRALELKPEDETGLWGLGLVHKALENHEEAIATWKRGLEKHPNSLRLQIALARAYGQEGDFSTAYKMLAGLEANLHQSNWRNLSPVRKALMFHQLQLLRGQFALAERRYGEAVRQLKNATTAASSAEAEGGAIAAEARLRLATAYSRLGQWELVANEYEALAAARTDAFRISLRLAAANAWTQANYPEGACRNLDILATQYETADIWLRIASARLARERSKPPKDRRWQSVEDALARCKNHANPLAEAWRLWLLEAEFLGTKASTLTDESARLSGYAEARKPLLAAEEAAAGDPRFLTAAISLYQQIGAPEDADRMVDELAKTDISKTALAVLRAQLTWVRGNPAEAEKILAAAESQADEKALAMIRNVRSQWELSRGDAQAALAVFDDPATDSAQKPRLALQLGEHALAQLEAAKQNGQPTTELAKNVERWENELRTLEGDDGVLWRALRARHLLTRLGTDAKSNAEVLKSVRELRDYILQARPHWPPSHNLSAAYEMASGNYAVAADALLRAVELGERRSQTLENLSILLFRLNRLADAERVMSLVQQRVPLRGDLAEVQFRLAQHAGDTNRLLDSAAKRVAAAPEDAFAQVRLGQAQWLAGDFEAAEMTMRAAIQLDETKLEPWIGLFSLFIAGERTEDARGLVQEMLTKATFRGPHHRSLVEAQCYELLLDPEAASASYAAALQEPTVDIPALLQISYYYVQNAEWDLAITAADKALKLSPGNQDARRLRALALSGRGKNDDIDQAIASIELKQEGQITIDERMRALLLSRNIGHDYLGNLEKAEYALRKLVDQASSPVPTDLMLLADVLIKRAFLVPEADVREKLLRDVDAVYRRLVGGAQPEASHLVLYLRFLRLEGRMREADPWLTKLEEAFLRRNAEPAARLLLSANLRSLGMNKEALAALKQAGSALEKQTTWDEKTLASYISLALQAEAFDGLGVWLDRLDEVTPESLGALELRTRWLMASSQSDAIGPAVERFVKRVASTATPPFPSKELNLNLGHLLLAQKLYPEAEHYYQQANQELPATLLGLAQAAAWQSKWQQCVELCQAADRQLNSALAPSTLAALLLEATTLPQSPAGEQFLTDALERFPKDAQLALAVSNLRLRNNRLEEAVAILERAIQAHPRNSVLLNNLATLLAEMPGRQGDAITYIHQAIQLHGLTASLLDTKGVALLYSGKPDEAVHLFERACRLEGSASVFALHLAAAYDKLGDAPRAKQALLDSRARTTGRQILTPSDQKLIETLSRRYDVEFSQMSNPSSPRRQVTLSQPAR